MLVCPECRKENPEEARFCTRCGRSMEPVAGMMPRTERRADEAEEVFEFHPPKPPNPLVGIIGLAVAVLVVLGGALWWVLRPNPCEGKFESSRYPYCVAVPVGWQQGTQQIGEQSADTFRTPSGDALVQVMAQQVPSGTDTMAFAEAHRERQEAGGLLPGPIEQVTVDEREALAWELSLTTEDGDMLRSLEVVVVQGGTGWRISFAGTQESFDRERSVFGDLLQSWDFQ